MMQIMNDFLDFSNNMVLMNNLIIKMDVWRAMLNDGYFKDDSEDEDKMEDDEKCNNEIVDQHYRQKMDII